jgi:D-specific alpha-keto acid dehydrogenase
LTGAVIPTARTTPRTAARPARTAGIAVFGSTPDEALLFRELAPGLGVDVAITEAPLSASTVPLAAGARCVSVGHRTRVDDATLRALAEAGVVYLSTRSTGRDHIDLDLAARLGITVEGVAYSPGSVADHALMLMLMVLRSARSTLLRASANDFRVDGPRGRELGDLTVGVVGTGRIGTAVIARLRGFGSRILAYDRNPKSQVEYVALHTLLRESDVVTLHAPLAPDSRHLLDADRIGAMKPGAVVVNTSRGGLVDTEALAAALESGRLGGAALDVLEGEERVFYRDHGGRPLPDAVWRRLHALPNVVITPHTAYYTAHALEDVVRNTILNCLGFEGRTHA